MKKELLQKISGLCCFALEDKECIKLQTYLLLEDYASARIYLDKLIDNLEFCLAFDELKYGGIKSLIFKFVKKV